MKTVAQEVAESLKEAGVTYVFGVPSGNWVDYMAAIEATDGLEFILISNEGSGGFMADVCWRLTGNIAACFGTFGPGACNLTTGVCGGFLDRSPMIAFSDEMSDKMLNRTAQMNIDHQALFKPITKWTTRLEAGKVRQTIDEAVQIAKSEIPGPVHIGLPSGIGGLESAEENIEFKSLSGKDIAQDAGRAIPDNASLTKMLSVFSDSKKPVIALGLTTLRFDVQSIIIEIIEKFKVPVVLTPMAKGMIPEDHPCYAGVLAHALGNMVGKTHQQADLVVGIGFDPVELNYEDWMPDVPLLHINTVPADIDTHHTLACNVVGDLETSLAALSNLESSPKEWDMEALLSRKKELFAMLAPEKGNNFGPSGVLDSLRKALPEDGIMTCDVGAHLHLIGQQWRTPSKECQLMTNGCSSMGFAIPAAIAAKLSCPHRPVCCVVGDGGLYMMAGEMATAMRLGTNIVFIVMMDQYLSLIRIKQEAKGNSRYGTVLQTSSGNCHPADSLFGVPVLKANNQDEFDAALEKAFEADGPIIVEASIHTEDYEKLVLKGNK
jgi:acetolactate synthase-1/2/3 large subunit